MELYVKNCSNCPGGMPLVSFQELSKTWSGETLSLPFGEGVEKTICEVVGITSLIGNPVGAVHVVKVHIDAQHSTTGSGADGYLVYGGDHGVRILDEAESPLYEDYPESLKGYGQPIVWVEDLHDLPEDVQAVVSVRILPYSIQELAEHAIEILGNSSEDALSKMLSRIRGRIRTGSLASEKVGKERQISVEAGEAFLVWLQAEQRQK